MKRLMKRDIKRIKNEIDTIKTLISSHKQYLQNNSHGTSTRIKEFIKEKIEQKESDLYKLQRSLGRHL